MIPSLISAPSSIDTSRMRTWVRQTTLSLAAMSVTATAVFVGAPADAFADCADPRYCLCAANSSGGGLYRATVEGSDSGGTQLTVNSTIERDSTGFEPDQLVADVFEQRGTEVLIREGGGFLVIESSSSVRCASGAYGDTLSISLDDAVLLSTVSNCENELSNIDVRGDFPECDDTPGGVACSATGRNANRNAGGFLIALLGLTMGAYRRRR